MKPISQLELLIKMFENCLVGVAMVAKCLHHQRTGMWDCGIFCQEIARQDIDFHRPYIKYSFILLTSKNLGFTR